MVRQGTEVSLVGKVGWRINLHAARYMVFHSDERLPWARNVHDLQTFSTPRSLDSSRTRRRTHRLTKKKPSVKLLQWTTPICLLIWITGRSCHSLRTSSIQSSVQASQFGWLIITSSWLPMWINSIATTSLILIGILIWRILFLWKGVGRLLIVERGLTSWRSRIVLHGIIRRRNLFR